MFGQASIALPSQEPRGRALGSVQPFELDLSSDEEPGEAALVVPPAGSDAFIDDPDDTDWGFDELADPSDEDLAAPADEPLNVPPVRQDRKPISSSAEPDFTTDGETLELGDEGDFSADFADDFADSTASDLDEAPAKASKPAKPAKPTKPTRQEKAPRPSPATRQTRAAPTGSALTSRLMRASIVLFGVSVIELGVYLALHLGWLP